MKAKSKVPMKKGAPKGKVAVKPFKKVVPKKK